MIELVLADVILEQVVKIIPGLVSSEMLCQLLLPFVKIIALQVIEIIELGYLVIKIWYKLLRRFGFFLAPLGRLERVARIMIYICSEKSGVVLHGVADLVVSVGRPYVHFGLIEHESRRVIVSIPITGLPPYQLQSLLPESCGQLIYYVGEHSGVVKYYYVFLLHGIDGDVVYARIWELAHYLKSGAHTFSADGFF